MGNLATKYRPTAFNDVVGQSNIIHILSNQLTTGTTKNAYLFVGSQGTGKTTCARIFANEVNHGQGNPIEMDAASNSGVDDVRNIIQQAQTKSLDSEYKVFIIDECHSISNTGWQAFLKLIEEPPAKSIFIFCTTNPEKIPKTILSRVQRFDFQRISQKDIVERLCYVLYHENIRDDVDINAVEYIAKIADGGMRDALTLLDKCLSYDSFLSLENVIQALGIADYDILFELYDAIHTNKQDTILNIIEKFHADGKDLKAFVRMFLEFVFDIEKYRITGSYDYVSIPSLYEIKSLGDDAPIIKALLELHTNIKWDNFPKPLIEITLCQLAKERK